MKKNFDNSTTELEDLAELEQFVHAEVERGINAPLLIGGEPALFLDRIEVFKRHMPKVSLSTNGLRKVPYEGFGDISIGISLFGGGLLEDELRAIGPTGKRFTGLLGKVLNNYQNDERAGFVYAVIPKGIAYIEDTVRRIADNGNRLIFNYYSDYGSDMQAKYGMDQRLQEVLLKVAEQYPETVVSHPYYIKVLVSGKTSWGEVNYMNCPSISEGYAGNQTRLKLGGQALPKFNAYAADMKTITKCCTSGEGEKCRDSQAVTSWLLVNAQKMMQEPNGLRVWVEIAEAYFSQFVWSSYPPRNQSRNILAPVGDLVRAAVWGGGGKGKASHGADSEES